PEPSSSSSSSRMSSSRSDQTASSGSIFDYDPVQLIYSCMDGTPNISSILSGTSNPNLSHSLNGNNAHFMFYDSDYYFTLKPGVTYVRGCEKTMQLAVTDPDRSVR